MLTEVPTGGPLLATLWRGANKSPEKTLKSYQSRILHVPSEERFQGVLAMPEVVMLNTRNNCRKGEGHSTCHRHSYSRGICLCCYITSLLIPRFKHTPVPTGCTRLQVPMYKQKHNCRCGWAGHCGLGKPVMTFRPIGRNVPRRFGHRSPPIHRHDKLAHQGHQMGRDRSSAFSYGHVCLLAVCLPFTCRHAEFDPGRIGRTPPAHWTDGPPSGIFALLWISCLLAHPPSQHCIH